MSKRRYRPWTMADHDRLVQMHAEGRTDAAIARAMDREKVMIGKKRRALGLPKAPKPKDWLGRSHSEAAKAKIAAAHRALWADPAYRERMQKRAARSEGAFRAPEQRTPEWRYYAKVRSILGAAAARATVAGNAP